jgi:hypothetical protein
MESESPARESDWMLGHDVQFYESDDFLVQSVVQFLVKGLRAGQPIVVIATAAHRRAIMDGIRAAGQSIDHLVEGKDLLFLDARETLSAFMEGGRPSAELFDATVGSLFEQLVRERRYMIVRAYGEMVDLLWQDGKASAAIEVEELWNALARRYSFALLCAYAESTLKMCDGKSVADICAAHTRVRQPESAPLGERLGIAAA